MSADIAITPESRKKPKVSTKLENYMLIYSGVASGRFTAAELAVIIKSVLKNRINCYQFVNEK